MTPSQFIIFYRTRIIKIIRSLKSLEIPTIAAVNGAAYGLGCEIALACDIRIGSENANLCEAFIKRGNIPAGGGTWTLPRIVGLAKANELIFTGREVKAQEAETIGLLNKVVSQEDLMNEAMAMARTIASNGPQAVRFAKLNIYAGLDTSFERAFDMLTAFQAITATSEERKGVIAVIRGRGET